MNTTAGYLEEESGNPTEKQLPGNPPTQTQTKTQLPGMTTTDTDNKEDQQEYQDLLMDYQDQLVDYPWPASGLSMIS